jgi:hypothetical protein
MATISYLENRFYYKGYPCVVLFHPFCHRCGYVGVPTSHPYYGKEYYKLPDIDVHGGVTYCENSLYNCDDKDTWWIGFDCAHVTDKPDYEAGLRYFANDSETIDLINYKIQRKASLFIPLKVRTLEFVENELKHLVDQIVEAENNGI